MTRRPRTPKALNPEAIQGSLASRWQAKQDVPLTTSRGGRDVTSTVDGHYVNPAERYPFGRPIDLDSELLPIRAVKTITGVGRYQVEVRAHPLRQGVVYIESGTLYPRGLAIKALMADKILRGVHRKAIESGEAADHYRAMCDNLQLTPGRVEVKQIIPKVAAKQDACRALIRLHFTNAHALNDEAILLRQDSLGLPTNPKTDRAWVDLATVSGKKAIIGDERWVGGVIDTVRQHSPMNILAQPVGTIQLLGPDITEAPWQTVPNPSVHTVEDDYSQRPSWPYHW